MDVDDRPEGVAAGLSDAAEIESSLQHPERFATIFDRYASQIHRLRTSRSSVALSRTMRETLSGDASTTIVKRVGMHGRAGT